jgi:DNA repair protein RadC
MTTGKETPHYLGHRKRLREKLLARGRSALADYEILELLLAMAIPRRDTKPMAKDLIGKFGGFADVIGAPVDQLRAVAGLGDAGAAAIKTVEAAQVLALESRIAGTSVIANWQDLIDYCKLNIGNLATEEFHVLYLNTKCRLIEDEAHSAGTVNASSVYPREILKRALELGATSVILVHNHPTGDATPSRADIAITEKIRDSLKAIEVALHDHIIVAKGNFASLKALGLI